MRIFIEKVVVGFLSSMIIFVFYQMTGEGLTIAFTGGWILSGQIK